VIVAVFDTNVLASGYAGLARLDSTPGELVRRWHGRVFNLVVSEAILAELTRVFRTPYFTRRLSPAEIESAFARLRSDTLVQPITVHVSGVAAHAQDDAILATALSAQAPYLVTGDKPLLARVAYRGTQIVSPRQFLKVLDRDNPRIP
jgi:uncharacterized protein